MIKTIIKRNSEGNITEFSINGHANYGKHGQDIVCSAVSVLAQTALLGLHHYAKVNFDHKMSEGYLYCKLSSEISEEKNIIVNSILETMLLGLKNIKEEYSSYINLKEEEV